MAGRFQIEHKDGREYGLTSLKVFHERYEPEGFVISKQQPNFGIPWEAPKDAAKRTEKPAEGTKAEAKS